MTSTQHVDGVGVSPWPVEMPADLAADADAFEDAVFEARACGDVGFLDRMWSWWWPELDTHPCPDLDQLPPIPPEDEFGGEPSDPLERHGTVALLVLAARAKNHADAAHLAAVHHSGHTQNLFDSRGRPRRDPFATREVGAALQHAEGVAGYQLWLAEAIIDRLPKLWAAMAEGWLDLAKATVFATDTAGMPDDLARLTTARLLPRTPGLSKGELGEAIGIAAAQLDPDWAARREQAAHTRVRVEYSRNPTGTADIALRDITAPAQASIRARSEAITRELRVASRRLGLRLGMPALRGLVAQRLLEGTYLGLDEHALITALIAELPTWHTELTTPEHDTDEPDTDEPDTDGSDDQGPDDSGPDRGPSDTDPDDEPRDGPDDGAPGDRPADNGSNDRGTDTQGTDCEPDLGRSADEPATGTESTSGAEGTSDTGEPTGPVQVEDSPAPRPGVRVGTLELRMRLSTALGLDQLPATIPGTGPITTARARTLLHDIHHSGIPTEHRLVLVDEHGHLEHVLLIRPDPATPPRSPGPRREAHRRGTVRGQRIVELTSPTTLLAALNPDDHPDWTRHLHRAQHQLADLATQGADLGGPNHPATTTADADRRLPGAALARYIRVRDRHCIGPLCPRPAHHADIDHTHHWARHGPTIAANLGAPCRACHALKHEGGWELTQPTPGRFCWTSPLGASYTVEPRPILDPPFDPSPLPGGRHRPVLDVPPAPKAGDTGQTHHGPRMITPAPITTPPTSKNRAILDDYPPPF